MHPKEEEEGSTTRKNEEAMFASVRGLLAVEARVWFPRAVSVHGGLRIQRGCQ